MKKIVALIIYISGLTLFTSCGKVDNEISILPPLPPTTIEKINTQLTEMVTFESEATVRYISNKGENEYTTLQQVKDSGEYRIEVIAPEGMAGNVTVSDGETITQLNKRLNAKVSLGMDDSKERTAILLTNFITNYFSSDNAIQSEPTSEDNVTILEANIHGSHPYISRQELIVDNDTLKPIKLLVYDPNGKERIVVTYNTFEYNIELEDSLFQLE